MSDTIRHPTSRAAATAPSSGRTRARGGRSRPVTPRRAAACFDAAGLLSAGARSPATTEEWISTPAAPKPAEPVQRGPDLRLDELAAPNENPIMRAAGPLLLLLGRLRVALLQGVVRAPDGAGRRRDHVLREGNPLRRHPRAAGEHREIHSLRHRRRHRPEHPDRRPACVDPIQHAEPLLRRAHRRRAVLRGAGKGAEGSARQLSAARAAAHLPGARLPGRASFRTERPVRRCSRSSAISTRRCGASGRRSPTIFRRAGRGKASPAARRGCACRSGWWHRSPARCCSRST